MDPKAEGSSPSTRPTEFRAQVAQSQHLAPDFLFCAQVCQDDSDGPYAGKHRAEQIKAGLPESPQAKELARTTDFSPSAQSS